MNKQQKIAVLKRARTYLRRPKGWIQGSYERQLLDKPYPGFCLSGACDMAAKELGLAPKEEYVEVDSEWAINEISLEKAASEILRKDGSLTKYNGVPDFNDDHRTKKKDVLALIDLKIAELGG